MPITMTMPRLSDTMERGAVVAWHVKEGDPVSSGDVVADIETDKATMELQTFDDGVVAKLAVAEGDTVDVGATILILAEEGEDASAAVAGAGASSGPAEQSAGSAETAAPTPAATTAVAEPPAPATNGAASASAGPDGGRIFVSPLARKVAEEKGVDLSTINGSGPGGRIVKRDVESAQPGAPVAVPASAPQLQQIVAAPSVLEDRVEPLSNMRATIARRLVESKTTVPHYQVTVSSRLDALMDLRAQLNDQLASQGVKLSVNDFIVRACALAMAQHPYVNSSWMDQGPSIHLHGSVNVGVAIALPPERGGGLVVATLRNADQMGIRMISAETKRLAKKAREKGLTIEEMSDSTFTISNLGMFGVDHFTAIINPPNSAILAVGQGAEKPFIARDEDGEPVIEIGTEMSMTMSSDHRVIDGAMAAQYLSDVKAMLENPATLLV